MGQTRKVCLVTGDAYDDYLRVCPFDIWPEVQNLPTCYPPHPPLANCEPGVSLVRSNSTFYVLVSLESFK